MDFIQCGLTIDKEFIQKLQHSQIGANPNCFMQKQKDQSRGVDNFESSITTGARVNPMGDLQALDLRKVRWKHIKTGFSYTLWSALFCFLPLLVSLLIAILKKGFFDHPLDLQKFYINGDFAIITSGILSSVVLVLIKRRAVYPFFSLILCMVIIAMLAAFVVWMVCNGVLPLDGLNPVAVFWVSTILVCFSFAINAFSIVCDECLVDVDLNDYRTSSQDALEQKFKKT